MDRFKICPLLENFQQQAVSIRYYTDNRQFIYPEKLGCVDTFSLKK